MSEVSYVGILTLNGSPKRERRAVHLQLTAVVLGVTDSDRIELHANLGKRDRWIRGLGPMLSADATSP